MTSIICDSNSEELINNVLRPFIQNDGTTIVFCDGGNKIHDFINYTPLIKKGDYICVHDYCVDRNTFTEEYYKKIWNYCRLTEFDIKGISDEYGLINVYDNLQKGMWRVKMKISDNITIKPKSLI